jgi:hypothetical protein
MKIAASRSTAARTVGMENPLNQRYKTCAGNDDSINGDSQEQHWD